MYTEPLDKDTRMWAMVCHLSAFAGVTCIPFANILGPLIVWLVKREQSPFVDDHGKESLNFQISMTIYGFIAGILTFAFVGWVLVPAIVLATIVLVIIAAVKANNGEGYRYPMTIRLVQ